MIEFGRAQFRKFILEMCISQLYCGIFINYSNVMVAYTYSFSLYFNNSYTNLKALI